MIKRALRKIYRLLSVPAALSLIVIAGACGDAGDRSENGYMGTGKKLIVVGFDGMDPKILRKLMDEGKLPNFKLLSEEGDFRELATSVPPQSPVAWSNFITGMNSGGHGIFDFIHRDPKTMFPYLSTSETEAPETTISIGEW